MVASELPRTFSKAVSYIIPPLIERNCSARGMDPPPYVHRFSIQAIVFITVVLFSSALSGSASANQLSGEIVIPTRDASGELRAQRHQYSVDCSRETILAMVDQVAGEAIADLRAMQVSGRVQMLALLRLNDQTFSSSFSVLQSGEERCGLNFQRELRALAFLTDRNNRIIDIVSSGPRIGSGGGGGSSAASAADISSVLGAAAQAIGAFRGSSGGGSGNYQVCSVAPPYACSRQ